MGEICRKRWRDFFTKAEAGGELTVGFIGGSVTQGCLASEEAFCFARRVYDWLAERFPQTVFTYINAGVGGTTSHFGAARAGEDLLQYEPDAVIVDFSVNDEPGDFFRETFEGVVRKILGYRSRPAVLILHNIYYDSGKNAEKGHREIADHYGIPQVSVREGAYRAMKEGRYTMAELTPDGLHPNDLGHKLAAEQITAWMAAEAAEVSGEGENAAGKPPVSGPGRRSRGAAKPEGRAEMLPPPLTANAYEHAKRRNVKNISPVLSGFLPDTRERTGCGDCFSGGWTGRHAGDRITFSLEASCIAVQYKKTMRGPVPGALLILDGESEAPTVLDGNFDEDWDCLWLEPVLHHGRRGRHKIEIILTEDCGEHGTPFYLAAIVTDCNCSA